LVRRKRGELAELRGRLKEILDAEREAKKRATEARLAAEAKKAVTAAAVNGEAAPGKAKKHKAGDKKKEDGGSSAGRKALDPAGEDAAGGADGKGKAKKKAAAAKVGSPPGAADVKKEEDWHGRAEEKQQQQQGDREGAAAKKGEEEAEAEEEDGLMLPPELREFTGDPSDKKAKAKVRVYSVFVRSWYMCRCPEAALQGCVRCLRCNSKQNPMLCQNSSHAKHSQGSCWCLFLWCCQTTHNRDYRQHYKSCASCPSFECWALRC
jgi:hypothetical protein